MIKVFQIFLVMYVVFASGCKTSHRAVAKNSKKIEAKYALLLGVDKDNISNKKLFSFIDEWYGVPYKYGGKTKKGIDCSGFASLLLKEIYGKEMNGSSLSIYAQCKHIPKEELREGDLVFFKIDSKDISHIGVYLQNNKFVHATTKEGIMIDDLNEEYYRKYFFEAGKIK